MTQLAWARYVEGRRHGEQQFVGIDASNHGEDAIERYRVELASVVARLQWCQSRVEEIRRILHS